MSALHVPPPALYSSTMATVAQRYPLVGAALLRHRNARRGPMSFRIAPYLAEWYCDFGQYPRGIGGADIVSAPQVFKTELLFILQLYEAGWRGRLTAHAMPTASARNGLVKDRLNPLLVEVPAYRIRLPARDLAALQRGESSGDTGSMRSKRFGNGQMRFVAAGVDADWVEYSVDTFIIDEYDLCLAQSALNVAKVKDRMRASGDPRLYRLGNAEVPRKGIERLFMDGDARLFHWRCPHCGERQPISWLDSLVEQADSGAWQIRDPAARADPGAPIRPVCRRCREPFERDAAGAAWVATTPSRPRRSYRVTRFDNLGQEVREAWNEWVLAQASTELLRVWWRGWEGLAYESAAGGLTREDIVTGAVLPPMDWNHGDLFGDRFEGRAVTAGIDVGALFNIVISELVRGAGGRVERRAIWVGTVQSKTQVEDLLQRYRVRTGVMDADPETRIAQEIRDEVRRRFGCDLWLCRFAPTPKVGREEFGMKLDHRNRLVHTDRTQLLDAAADGIRVGRSVGRVYAAAGMLPPPAIRGRDAEVEAGTWAVLGGLADGGAERARLWPCDVDSVPEFVPQMVAPRRLFTDSGRIVWDEGGAPDHYRLADAYELLAVAVDQRGASVM